MRLVKATAIAIIRLYQYALSPWLGVRCRFEPSCSHYAAEAIDMHGAIKGSWLGLRRLLRCHPWGGSGYDAVPQAVNSGRWTVKKR